MQYSSMCSKNWGRMFEIMGSNENGYDKQSKKFVMLRVTVLFLRVMLKMEWKHP